MRRFLYVYICTVRERWVLRRFALLTLLLHPFHSLSLPGSPTMETPQASQDVVICADAFDVMVMGGASEILRVFEDLE